MKHPHAIFVNVLIERFFHFYYHCPKITIFWKEVLSWLKSKNIIIKDPTPDDLLLCYTGDDNVVLLNTVFLCGRHYIYCCKYQDISPQIQPFIAKILALRNIEENISLSKTKLDFHKRKWQPLLWEFIFFHRCYRHPSFFAPFFF